MRGREKPAGSGEETELLRCMFSKGMDVSFQVRLDERERPSCVKEAEVSSTSPFMKTAGKL